MIVRTLEDIREDGREVASDGWTSRRYLLKKDGMGFSFHQTIIHEGASLEMEYKNHLEAVFCTAGKGTIYSYAEDKTYEIEAGTMYALNEHDKHRLVGITEMTMMCVFNPPVTGKEVHRADGAYPLVEEEA